MQNQKCSFCDNDKDAVGLVLHKPMCLDCMRESVKLIEKIIEAAQAAQIQLELLPATAIN